MVNYINNIQQGVIPKNNNTDRNTAIAIGIGAIGGSTIGYATKNISVGDKFTDEFIKKINDITISKDCNGNKTEIKFMKDALKLDDNPSLNEFRAFMRKHHKAFNVEKKDIEKFLAGIDDNIVNSMMKRYVNPIKKGQRDAINNFIFNYDFKNKKFTFDKNDKELAKIANKAKHYVKGKAGLIWGTISAVVLGLGTYTFSKIKENNSNKK